MFALIDCNNFYVSCERIFNPKLKNKPVIILSNNDGCVVALSNEAKQLNIPFGSPFFKIQDIIKKHNVFVFSSNYELYSDISFRVMNALLNFSPDIEIYSIDEAFLSFKKFKQNSLTQYCFEIKNKIKKWIGVPISIGIGKTKTLAKLSCEIAKKNPDYKGVFNINECENIEKLFKEIKVEEIWGIGQKQKDKLNKRNIYTIFDYINSDDNWLKINLTIIGLKIKYELKGDICFELNEIPQPKKSIVSSRSFGKDVSNFFELKEAISNYTTIAAEKLRAQNSVTKNISVFIATNRFKKDEPQYANIYTTKLPIATANTGTLIKYAIICLEKIFKPDYKYKKAGVMFTEIISKEKIELNLFEEKNFNDILKEEKLMNVIDKINEKYGNNTIKYLALGLNNLWKMQRNQLSKRYTTNWNEILEINC